MVHRSPSKSSGSQARRPRSQAITTQIDFENITNVGNISTREANTQVGLAVLDTRDILTSIPSEKLILTYNFVTGSEEHYHQAQLKFLFGKPILILARDMLNSIIQCIPRDRNVLLVGHDVRHELHALSKLRIEFRELRISGLLDTFKITN